jgi:hypothetical protein
MVIPKTIQELRIKTDAIMGERPGLALRSRSPHLYNCVGMIFASRRAIIEIDHIYRILEEDGYRRIAFDDIMVGDLVLYVRHEEPEHIGVISQVQRIGASLNVKVLSKWGLLAEFEHFIENVPERYGQASEFYSERQL